MFYAFVHKHGPEMRGTDGKRFGHVEWFDSKHMRDVFVNANHDNEAISSKVARWHLVNELLADRPELSEEAKYMTAHMLVENVRNARTEDWGC